MVGIKGKSGKYERTKEHKNKIKRSLKEYYSIPKNKEILVKNLNIASKSRTPETFKKAGGKHKESIRKGLAKTRKGQKNSLEQNKKIGDANKISLKKFWDNNLKAKLKKSSQLKKFWENPEQRLNKSKEIMKFWKDNPNEKIRYSKYFKELWVINPELRLKINKLIKRAWESEIVRKKASDSSKQKWQNPEYREKTIKNSLRGLMKRPTSFEKKIAELCIGNSLPFIYTGNGQFLINFKNPDFVNEKDKIVIEVFYSWFKIRDYGSVENYKEFCRKKYNSAGWRVIFIDENEVDCDNWKEICLNKIKNFEEENYFIEVK
jgi:hypothetical protein